ncbi:MAG: amidohydrolase family protein [Chloroflexota bacterium]
MAVIDSHVHVFSPGVMEDRDRACVAEPWFRDLYADPAARLASPEDLLAAMDGAGVAFAVAAGFPWRDIGRARSENDFLAETCAGSGGRIRWLANVPPLAGEAAAAEADRCFALGAAGVGELNADAQGFDLADSRLLAPLAAACVSAGRPAMLHASEPLGHRYPGKGSATPDRLLALVSAFPDLPIVLAHWGGGLPFYELMPEVAEACARVVYDTAASTYLYRPGVFRAVLDIAGPERVLWGSDFPVLGMGRFLRRTTERSGVRVDELPALLSGNARRVYGIGE